MSEAQNPYAPPLAEVKDAPPAERELAGRGTRLVAAIVDGLLQAVLIWGAASILPWSLFSAESSAGQLVGLAALGLVAFLLLQGYLLVQRGQTIGKIALGLRIVRTDGSKAGAGRILGLRYVLGLVIGVVPVIGVVYALVDCLLIFRQSRQCLHDQIADTIVVKA